MGFYHLFQTKTACFVNSQFWRSIQIDAVLWHISVIARFKQINFNRFYDYFLMPMVFGRRF